VCFIHIIYRVPIYTAQEPIYIYIYIHKYNMYVHKIVYTAVHIMYNLYILPRKARGENDKSK